MILQDNRGKGKKEEYLQMRTGNLKTKIMASGPVT